MHTHTVKHNQQREKRATKILSQRLLLYIYSYNLKAILERKTASGPALQAAGLPDQTLVPSFLVLLTLQCTSAVVPQRDTKPPISASCWVPCLGGHWWKQEVSGDVACDAEKSSFLRLSFQPHSPASATEGMVKILHQFQPQTPEVQTVLWVILIQNSENKGKYGRVYGRGQLFHSHCPDSVSLCLVLHMESASFLPGLLLSPVSKNKGLDPQN